MSDYVSEQGRRLAQDAAEAAEIRDALTHPDVVALRVDKVRIVVDRLIWAGITAGLLFTMINVQTFAAQHARTFTLGWWAAWFLDPTVAVILLGVLIAEGVTSRWQVSMGWWSRVAKWVLLSATYVMNTWEAFATQPIWWAGVALHSVPPLAVFMGAECRTDIQDKLTECVCRVHAFAQDRAEQKAAGEQARRDRIELDRLRHEATVATERARIAQAVAPAVEEAVAATVAPTSKNGQRPRVSTANDRSRRAALDVDELAQHARPILAEEPDLGRRELANRLSELLKFEVPPYWAQKAKNELAKEDERPLRAVAH